MEELIRAMHELTATRREMEQREIKKVLQKPLAQVNVTEILKDVAKAAGADSATVTITINNRKNSYTCKTGQHVLDVPTKISNLNKAENERRVNEFNVKGEKLEKKLKDQFKSNEAETLKKLDKILELLTEKDEEPETCNTCKHKELSWREKPCYDCRKGRADATDFKWEK